MVEMMSPQERIASSLIDVEPSAMRLNEKTETKMARPGKMESHGALVS